MASPLINGFTVERNSSGSTTQVAGHPGKRPSTAAQLVTGSSLAALLPLLFLMAAATQKTPPPDASLAILNGVVWTADSAKPWAEAIAVRGDRIIAVGSTDQIRRFVSPQTRVIDAGGEMVAPGFIDSHIHFLAGGLNLASVQLRDATTPADFVARIKTFAATVPAGVWITGGDWDHQNWGGELPQRSWIDSVTPNNPVWINRLDGHMALANTAALRAAKVPMSGGDVAGGTITRDGSGQPTGIFKDNAQELIDKAVPDPAPAMLDRALEAAMTYANERGVTSVDHMGTWSDLAVFERAHHAGTLRTRIYASVPLSTWARLRDTVAARGRGDSWLRIGGLKGFVDGSLGSHTAAMMQPFADAPNDTGLLVNTPEDLYSWTSNADKSGLHVIVHAIGDRAIDLQLNIFERVARENGPRDRRFRIEHAQHIAPADVARFGQLGVIPSMQPYHAIDDGRWAEKVIGHERAKTTYAFRSLKATGARLAFGSDWPVAPATPLEGIYAAVTRRTLDDKNPSGWIPEQKISVEDALRAYTLDAAYATFEEKDKGSIAVDKLADIVIIDRDLTRIPAASIREARIDYTIAGGRVVYQRNSNH
ncbi:MAG TPA: amidohydrolase [Gemmatimonadaceae bacterium]|nr:amidohydrolase [Gemmatimonadaceae bacterium]